MKKSLLSSLFLGASLCLGAQAPLAGMMPAYAQTGGLNYQQADLRQVIKDVSVRTGRSFVIGPNIQQTITIYSPEQATLTPDETWEMFLAALQVSNLAAVPIGPNEYKIILNDKATREGGSGFGNAAGGEYVVRVVSLTYVDSRQAANSLKALVSDRAVVSPIVESNKIIIVDVKSNMDRLLEVVRKFDTDNSLVRTVKLQNAQASQVADTLRNVTGARNEAGRSNALSVVAVDSNNSLIIRGAPAEVRKILPIISELDATGVSEVALGVVYLKHADAETVVPLLKDIIDSSFITPEGGSQKKPSISAHKPTNALIINADPETQKMIQSVISQLDIRRSQVQIEAIIVELSDNVAKSLGLQYVYSGSSDDNTPFISNSVSGGNPNATTPNILAAAGAAYLLGTPGATSTDGSNTDTALGATLLESTLSSLLGANGLTLGWGAEGDDGSLFGVILNAAQSDANSRVLSTPSITVLDNEEARLQSGLEIPVTTGESLGGDFDNVFRTTERQEVGVILEVTPQISEGGTVIMKVKQEVSGVLAGTTASGGDVTISKNVAETILEAENGQILIMGGLLTDTDEYTDTKIPLLGDIPIAGNLFKSSTRTRRNSTLMVFIKPTILDTRAVADAATARKYNYVRGEEMLRFPVTQSDLDRIVSDYLGTGIEPTYNGFTTGGTLQSPNELRPVEGR